MSLRDHGSLNHAIGETKYEGHIDRTGATTGQVPILQGDSTLAFGTLSGSGTETVSSVAGRTGNVVLTSSDVGLANVDNTSDLNKPVSTAQAAADALALTKASNLSDLASTAAARTNLGLGTAAVAAATTFEPAGLASSTITSLNASYLQKTNNLSDLASAATARTNLGLGSAALSASTAFEPAGLSSTTLTALSSTYAQRSNNLSDLSSTSAARTNLGLGTAATSASTAFEPAGLSTGTNSTLASTYLTISTAASTYAPITESVNLVGTSGASQTIPSPATSSISRITLSANCTLTFPTAGAGKSFTLVLVQDGTGSRTVTWPGTVKWAAGTAPTLSTGAGKIDYLSFICTDGTNWAGFVAGLDIR